MTLAGLPLAQAVPKRADGRELLANSLPSSWGNESPVLTGRLGSGTESHARWREDSAVGSGGGVRMEGTELCRPEIPLFCKPQGTDPTHICGVSHPPPPQVFSARLFSARARAEPLWGPWLQGHLGAPTQTPV